MSERKPVKTYDPRQVGVLAGLRVRKKLMLLHTLFSLGLAVVLLLVANPVLNQIVNSAEVVAGVTALESLRGDQGGPGLGRPGGAMVEIEVGDAVRLGLSAEDVALADVEGGPVGLGRRGEACVSVVRLEDGRYARAEVVIPGARRSVVRLYGIALVSLLSVYALIALALEVFVLPKSVYRPIRTLLDADDATRRGDHEGEIIPDTRIPADELGEIMRSHNVTVRALREKERDLARALGELERVAADLKTKNDLLEAARRNLADADRLASLGMMSAGIAHELNTPLTVASGLTCKAARGETLSEPEMQLLARVIGRLERLGESLLDYARLRPPAAEPVEIRGLVGEAFTLVSLDRRRGRATLTNRVSDTLCIEADQDRLLQVLVNLVRNAVDAIGAEGGEVLVTARELREEGTDWVAVRVIDDGPGIDPEVLATLFEPFVSTKLDARGTGLGLAVAQGIVGEHGGTLVARNRGPDDEGGGAGETDGGTGGVFEIILPRVQPSPGGGRGGRNGPGEPG